MSELIITGKIANNLIYADDTILTAENLADVQFCGINKIKKPKYGLEVNIRN